MTKCSGLKHIKNRDDYRGIRADGLLAENLIKKGPDGPFLCYSQQAERIYLAVICSKSAHRSGVRSNL